MVFGASQYASLDMLLTALITSTITLAVSAVMGTAEDARWRWPLAYFCAALGMLEKGLIGFLFPGAIFVFWMLLTGRTRRTRPRAAST